MRLKSFGLGPFYSAAGRLRANAAEVSFCFDAEGDERLDREQCRPIAETHKLRKGYRRELQPAEPSADGRQLNFKGIEWQLPLAERLPAHLAPIVRQMADRMSTHLAGAMQVVAPAAVEGGTRMGSDSAVPTIEYDDGKQRLTVTGTVSIFLDLAHTIGQN